VWPSVKKWTPSLKRFVKKKKDRQAISWQSFVRIMKEVRKLRKKRGQPMDEKLGNDLRTLLTILAKVTSQHEYNFCVNTLAQLLMGHKFGYMHEEDDEIMDYNRFLFDARYIKQHGKPMKQEVKLKASGRSNNVIKIETVKEFVDLD